MDDIGIMVLFILGTHWVYEIIQMLVRNTVELEKNAKSSTMLEVLPDLSFGSA
jgi:hypothetical protein